MLTELETSTGAGGEEGLQPLRTSCGAITETIPLPPGVDGEKAHASFKNGVPTIRLPQTPEAQARV
ncbi:Hsp20/alpha crystallin family protein [Paracoccus mutanolyticus]|uniref:Hsp20/alpha crystallin family protein n=1 Tax=Paracoccus mutanolyticus TaxID=1499308 RepID=UPI0011AE777A|nr:Hsp20/alpha crystallin family protein [Paracoccus mutanolyticus]